MNGISIFRTMSVCVVVGWRMIVLGSVCGCGDQIPSGYVPPLLSNGDLSLILDYTGGMQDRSYCQLWPEFYRAGRRDPLPSAKLLGEGKLKSVLQIDGQDVVWPESWCQDLDVTNACVTIDARYARNIRIRSEAFVCEFLPVLAIRRRIENTGSETVEISSGVSFEHPRNPRVRGAWERIDNDLWTYSYDFAGYRMVRGVTSLLLIDEGGGAMVGTQRPSGEGLQKTFTLLPREIREQVSFAVFTDDAEVELGKLSERHAARLGRIRELGYDGLFSQHRERWNAYYGQSSVCVPDERIQRMYDVAQYHLKCNATRWSFPVGLFPHHWQGRYFGFDEMYAHQGLVSSGHFEVARRCPEFRFTTLKTAKMRCGHYTADGGAYGARWCWESVEDGLNECAPQGFWLDHIFHQATIARTAWTQYLFSGDSEYLRTVGYPIMKECARFYFANWLYEDSDGSLYVGKCTDLERLGPARNRPFMTTCGVIYTLRAAADAADVLDVDGIEAKSFRKAADRLVEGLPTRDGRYIPFSGSQDVSVAVLAGLYPFPVFDGGNLFQTAAAWHFMKNGRTGGNMYPFGQGTCPWYAAKMSLAMTFLGDRNEPAKWIAEAAMEQGCFGETYEINEPKHQRTPWFATASGCVIEAVNTMLLASINGVVRIAPSVPVSWQDYSFSLPAYGGIVVDCEVEKGHVMRLSVQARGNVRKHVKLVMPSGEEKEIETPWSL